jgi:hypothetical protein
MTPLTPTHLHTTYGVFARASGTDNSSSCHLIIKGGTGGGGGTFRPLGNIKEDDLNDTCIRHSTRNVYFILQDRELHYVLNR